MKSQTSKIEMANYTCKDCGFVLPNPIRKFGSSALGLFDDHRYPGRCILAYRKHVERFEDLWGEDSIDYVADIISTINAIKNAMGVDNVEINIAANAKSHLCVNLFPRGGKGDLYPLRSPWCNLRQPLNLEPDEKCSVIQAIGEWIEKGN